MALPNQPHHNKPNTPNLPAAPTGGDPSKDPNMIRVLDDYGRELFITRQQWREVLALYMVDNWVPPQSVVDN